MPASLIDRRYRVESILGEGGIGVVYRVWDQVAEREVALKRLTPAAAKHPLTVGLFEREFHTLKSFAHPHIVEAYDYGIAESAYYTMELLTGATAHELAPIPWEQTCSLLRDVASALALLHSRRLVHRDVTSKNIQRASDGSVKLIDFGSLALMGVADHCVGTPPFMAPETVRRLTLDQRTDLYSLGATAYHLLTGRHAFPARRVSELQDHWRIRPRPPSQIVNGIPSTLDDLVMSMLEADPMARPVNAGIVIARLTAIGMLPSQRSAQAARSFLIAPRLVGREPEIDEFKARIARAGRGDGSCLLLEAQSGMGRSRALEAFALEAQLAGALVVRASGSGGAVATELLAAVCAGLWDSMPDASVRQADSEVSALGLLKQLTQTRTVVVLVDDAHLYHPASLALLARLKHLIDGQRLLLVVSGGVPVPDGAAHAMRLLAVNAERVELRPLDLAQITQLLASCFDHAPNVRAIAAWCQAASAGRPGMCMALAQHLVDTGIAVYDGGVWALPESLSGQSLPESAEQLLDERIRRLDGDQLLWGQTLSLIARSVWVSSAECVSMMLPLISRARSHAALEGLSAAQLVVSELGCTRIAQSNVRESLFATLRPPLVVKLHRLLAELFEARGDEMSLTAAAHHLQQAGDHAYAVRVVSRYARVVTAEMSEERLAKLVLPFGEWGATFELALDFAEREGCPRHEMYTLYTAVMSAAALSAPHWLTRGEPLFAFVKEDTGFIYWSEDELSLLEHGGKAPWWKLGLRLLRATVRHLLAPRRRRGLSPVAALTLLGVYVTSALGVCNITQTFHVGVPPLARVLLPFRRLSSALDLLYELLAGSADAGRGLATGWQRLQGVLERLRTRVSGMPDVYRSTAHYIVGYLEALECRAPVGDPRCLEVADWLDEAGGFAAHACQLRMLYYLYAGEGAQAERCRQQLETLALTSERDNLSVIAGTKDVAQLYALSGDATGLRATLDSLESTAERFPGWRGQLWVYRGEYALLVGDLVQARSALDQALTFARPGENYSWAKAAVPYMQVLVRLGLIDEAVIFANQALEEAARWGFSPVYRRRIEMAAALVQAAAGQHLLAARCLDTLLSQAHEQGIRGVTLGELEEARALAALLSGDVQAFERAHLAVESVFANHDSPALVARYRRLLEMADRARLGSSINSEAPANARMLAQALDNIRERVVYAKPAHRPRQSLELLIEHCGATAGYLFIARGAEVELVASVGESFIPPGLEDLVLSIIAMDTDLSVGATVADAELESSVTDSRLWVSETGDTYVPVALLANDADCPFGIAVLRPQHHDGTLQTLAPQFVRALVGALTTIDDVYYESPITITA